MYQRIENAANQYDDQQEIYRLAEGDLFEAVGIALKAGFIIGNRCKGSKTSTRA